MDSGEGAVQRDGRTIAWRSVGSGPPLLLLNGYAASTADWDPTFLDALGASFEVILPDHRGMGASTWGRDDDELSVGTMAADVLALMDHLGIDAAPIAGWSMGGFVAQTVARAAADRVTALTLLSTDQGGPDAVLADHEVWARLIDSSGPPREQATRLLGLLFPQPLAEQIDAQVGELVAGARAALDQHVLRAQEAAMDAWHAAEPAPIAVAPQTLVAHGAQDVVIPPANAALLAARWGAAAPHTFEGCGHAFMAQVPTELAALIVAHSEAPAG